ncbi:MAG: hypothetical protein COA39_000100 [Sulfurimonas sp.]|nr:hypothetical protein [Sulfurimonas sp.]
MVKNIILKSGDMIISVAAVISYLAVIISAVGMMSQKWTFGQGLMTLIGGIIGVTIAFYFIFIIIDIRDSMREIKKSLISK